MSWFSSFMHPERGYDAAMAQLQKYFDQAQQTQQPFVNNATESYGGLSEAMKKLMNPQALQDEWSKGYSESEGANQAEGMAREHGLSAASSMGLMGSSPALSAIQGGTTKIALDEKNRYMEDLMKKYMSGIGLGENIYGTGANTAGQMGQNAMNMGQNSAGLNFGRTNAGGEMFGQGMGNIMKLVEQYLTGGFGTGSYGRGAWSPPPQNPATGH